MVMVYPKLTSFMRKMTIWTTLLGVSMSDRAICGKCVCCICSLSCDAPCKVTSKEQDQRWPNQYMANLFCVINVLKPIINDPICQPFEVILDNPGYKGAWKNKPLLGMLYYSYPIILHCFPTIILNINPYSPMKTSYMPLWLGSHIVDYGTHVVDILVGHLSVWATAPMCSSPIARCSAWLLCSSAFCNMGRASVWHMSDFNRFSGFFQGLWFLFIIHCGRVAEMVLGRGSLRWN